jgi:hypothetical protein
MGLEWLIPGLGAATSAVGGGALSGSPFLHALGATLPALGKVGGAVGTAALGSGVNALMGGNQTQPNEPPTPPPLPPAMGAAPPPFNVPPPISPGSLTATIGQQPPDEDPIAELIRKLQGRR